MKPPIDSALLESLAPESLPAVEKWAAEAALRAGAWHTTKFAANITSRTTTGQTTTTRRILRRPQIGARGSPHIRIIRWQTMRRTGLGGHCSGRARNLAAALTYAQALERKAGDGDMADALTTRLLFMLDEGLDEREVDALAINPRRKLVQCAVTLLDIG